MDKKTRNAIRTLAIIALVSILLNVCLTAGIIYLFKHPVSNYEPVMVIPSNVDLPPLEVIEEEDF